MFASGSTVTFNGNTVHVGQSSFSSNVVFTGLGATTFSVRPIFNGLTPWDSGNLVMTSSNTDIWSPSPKITRSNDLWTSQAFVTIVWSATLTIDFSTLFNGIVTLGGNTTLANPTNLKAGQTGIIKIVQDSTGSRTLAFGSMWKFVGGIPTASTAANSVDFISYIYDGTNLICVFGKGVA